MPLCQPVVVSAGKPGQWNTFKQDAHFTLQEGKRASTGVKAWWSPGSTDETWAYRIIITSTNTQVASAADITQIVIDWEVVQKIVSDGTHLDPEATAEANAALIERVLKQHWDKNVEPDKASGRLTAETITVSPPPNSQPEAPRERRGTSRIFFMPPVPSILLGSRRSTVNETPFPGIPLHKEGQTRVLSPRPSEEFKSDDTQDIASATTPPLHRSDGSRERELRAKFERSLNSLDQIADLSNAKHDDQYRVYVDSINSMLHELRILKQSAEGTPENAILIAEALCSISRASLDGARLVVSRITIDGSSTTTTPADPSLESSDQHKAKEGQGDTDLGSESQPSAVAESDAQAADDQGQAKKQPSDESVRLKRCMELFEAANKSLQAISPSADPTTGQNSLP